MAAIPSDNLSDVAEDQQAKAAARLPQLAESGLSTVESLADQKAWQTAVQACDEVAGEQVSLVTELIAASTAEEGRKVQEKMKTVRLARSHLLHPRLTVPVRLTF